MSPIMSTILSTLLILIHYIHITRAICCQCISPSGFLGCNDAICEANICQKDGWCCNNAWDTACAGWAEDVCNSGTLWPTAPTATPTPSPTTNPTYNPSAAPTTFAPTFNPTRTPTNNPTDPTLSPSIAPTNNPTTVPSTFPSNNPTNTPSNAPTSTPTHIPTNYSSNIPTNYPITSLPTTSAEEGQAIETTYDINMEQSNGNDTRSDTLKLLFIIFITFAAIIVVGCILFFIYRNKGKSMSTSVANERHIGIELNSMSTPRDDNVMLTPTAGVVMQNDDDIVANIMAKNDGIVLAVNIQSNDNVLSIASDMGGMTRTTSDFVDKNDEEKEVTFKAMLSVARIQCAQELMVSAIEERYKIELEEEGDNMDDSVDDVKGEYLQEGKNAYGLNENKTTNDGRTCTTTGAANDVNNQNEK